MQKSAGSRAVLQVFFIKNSLRRKRQRLLAGATRGHWSQILDDLVKFRGTSSTSPLQHWWGNAVCSINSCLCLPVTFPTELPFQMLLLKHCLEDKPHRKLLFHLLWPVKSGLSKVPFNLASGLNDKTRVCHRTAFPIHLNEVTTDYSVGRSMLC